MIKHDEKMTSITSSQSGIVVITEWNCKCSRQHYFLEASKLNISCKILCRPHCDSHLFLNTVCKYILEKCPLFGLWSFCLLPQGCGTLRCFSLDLPLTKHCGSWLRQVGILSAFMSDYWSGGKPLCVWYGVLVLSLFLCISAHLFHLHLYLSFSVKLGIFFIYLPGTVHPDDATERKRGNTLLTFYRFISYLNSEQQKPESFSYSLSFYLLT